MQRFQRSDEPYWSQISFLKDLHWPSTAVAMATIVGVDEIQYIDKALCGQATSEIPSQITTLKSSLQITWSYGERKCWNVFAKYHDANVKDWKIKYVTLLKFSWTRVNHIYLDPILPEKLDLEILKMNYYLVLCVEQDPKERTLFQSFRASFCPSASPL